MGVAVPLATAVPVSKPVAPWRDFSLFDAALRQRGVTITDPYAHTLA